MEKLQAALQKARQTREDGALLRTSEARASRPRRASQEAVEERWQALKPLDVPRRVLERNRVVSQEAGPTATPFDILRTKVLVQMRQHNWKRLAITSPMPSCGKTTSACNLALGLGRQKDLRSILLDLDLRSPSVNDFFATSTDTTIGDVLTRRVPFSEQALRVGNNVAVSMGAEADRDPTKLLLAAETTEILDEIERDYEPDIMIFDLPSVLVNDETRAFLKNADCALIVVRANTTRYGQFDTCEREIAEQTNVLGTMLNAVTYGS